MEASRGHQPEHEPFDHHRVHDLLARGAERAQRGEHAPALRNGDPERVEDDERVDEQRDAAEHEQEGPDRGDVVVPLRFGLLDGRLAALHLELGGLQRRDAPHELGA
jgi:hypothetical protein